MAAKSIPVWLISCLVGMASIILTLAADRVSIAAAESSTAAKVSSLEDGQKNYVSQHEAIIRKLDKLQEGQLQIQVAQQRIIDRQEEVRRKLGIEK